MDEEDESSCLASVGNFFRRIGGNMRHFMQRIFRSEQSATFEIVPPMQYGIVRTQGAASAASFRDGSQPPTDGEPPLPSAPWLPPTPPALPSPPFTHLGARKRLRIAPKPTCDLDTLTELRHALDFMQQKVQNEEKEKDDVDEDMSDPTTKSFVEEIGQQEPGRDEQNLSHQENS
ncbi:uncharacterized protein LOC111048990 [Nilaparvata lugens]|uniref:uncharacterized protein LOC111048990 n=1 Tax=Nilaparvata lugens TaxID=108931 RepID=UPI00193D8DE4|nr:uncharacterized protein LOC111048990 [Nilaparvata lugens]